MQRILFSRKVQEKGVVSVVRNKFDLVVITKTNNNIFLIYLYIYHLGRTHKFLIHALINFTTYYSTVTSKTNLVEVRGNNSWTSCVSSFFVSVREAGLYFIMLVSR